MSITISIDEAGNTGQDLLNSDQKAFVLASVKFEESELKKLVSIFNSNSEIHFVKLKNSQEGRKQILEFINHDLITENNIIISTCHKEYAVVANIVDKLIETVYYYQDIDIYRFGNNISLTNFIFYFGNFSWDKKLYKELLSEFVNMVRNKSESSVSKFYSVVTLLKNIESTKAKALLNLILESQKYISGGCK